MHMYKTVLYRIQFHITALPCTVCSDSGTDQQNHRAIHRRVATADQSCVIQFERFAFVGL